MIENDRSQRDAMLFNSTDFLVFFGVFLLAWYLVRDHLAARNLLIVVASYLFYAWWDYRFTALLLFSSVIDYAVALGMGPVGSSSPSSSQATEPAGKGASPPGNEGALENWSNEPEPARPSTTPPPHEPNAVKGGRSRRSARAGYGIMRRLLRFISLLLPRLRAAGEPPFRFKVPRHAENRKRALHDRVTPGLHSGSDRRSLRRRRLLLLVSLVSNLGVLFFFKYFDFFRESARLLLERLGIATHWTAWQFILPVGISFYTFQTLSYTIDVYRGHIAASRNLIQFMAYVSFFPQLVAGPIERAAHLLPQMARKLVITLPMVESGLWLFIWGMFKKVVLADAFAHLVEPVFKFVEPEASQTLIATTAFALQIYCDFSGYTDMARGMARLLGFDLMLNFNLPYFATSVQEFWRRWHISLSTWLRDYLYLPLGGNRTATGRTYLNLLIVMLLGGLWHGAAWNFVAWGLWQAVGLIVNRAWSETVSKTRRKAGSIRGFVLPAWLNWLLTMWFTLYGWLLFRSSSADQVLTLTASLAHWQPPVWSGVMFRELLVLTAPLLAMQVWQWRTGDLEAAMRLPRWGRGLLQAVLIYAIILFWQREAPAFIYFQF